MRKTILTVALLGLVSTAYAKNPKVYQTGQISQTNSVPCSATKNSKSQPPCREYTLQSENVVYTIRPRDQKHDLSLCAGDRAQFRLNKEIISSAIGSCEQQRVSVRRDLCVARFRRQYRRRPPGEAKPPAITF